LKRFQLQQILRPICAAGQSRKKIRFLFPREREPVLKKDASAPIFKLLIISIMKNLTVVLNIKGMSAPQLINQTRFYVQRVNDNPTSFPGCIATAARVTTAADELELADEAATDGGKTKTRLKADKYKALYEELTSLGRRVEIDAAGDETIVHLAGMEVKKTGIRTVAEFKVTQGDHQGDVKLAVKARPDTMYKWQYASDPSLSNWIDAGMSRSCKKAISHLASGVYWFRVIFMDDEGEHNGEAFKFAVT
jgi:hypothetical protein